MTYAFNANETLFCGEVRKWLDEVTYIAATRFIHERKFTIYPNKIKFLKTVQPDTIIEIIGQVESIGKFKVVIKVELYAEEM